MEEFYSLLQLLAMLVIDPRTGVLFILLIVASISDCRTFKIPNWLTGSGMAFGLIYNTLVPLTSHAGFLWAFEGLLLGFVMLLPLYVLRAMGAGDVKLMAMVGALLGVPAIVYVVISTFIVGGIAALGFALFKRALGRMLSNVKTVTQIMLLSAINGVRPGAPIVMSKSVGKLPYGVSISISAIGYVVAKQLGYA